jgi:glutathione S-transferase
MSLKLYFSPGACSFVPHAMLEMAGAAFEPAIVKLAAGEQHTPEYKAINPRSQVPVLVVDGQPPLTQVVAIANYLNERFPQSHFLPTEPLAKAQALSTLAWMNNSFHPTFTHVFRPANFADGDAVPNVKEFNRKKYFGLLQELDGMVGQALANQAWMTGAHPGPVDIYAAVLMRWGSIAGQNPEQLPNLWALANKVAALPAVARVIERERIKLNMFQTPALV